MSSAVVHHEKRHLSRAGDALVKRSPTAAAEAQRTRWGAVLAASSGAFRVPRVLDVVADGDDPRLTLEWIDGLSPIHEVLPARPDLVPRLARVFEALARAAPDPGEREVLPLDGTDRVALHGDMTAANVQYLAARDEIVVLDWSTAFWLGGRAGLGPRGYDALLFTMSLMVSTPTTQIAAKRALAHRIQGLWRTLAGGPALPPGALSDLGPRIVRRWYRYYVDFSGVPRAIRLFPTILWYRTLLRQSARELSLERP